MAAAMTTVGRAAAKGDQQQTVSDNAAECQPLMNGLKLDDDDSLENGEQQIISSIENDWGFPIAELYKLALTFHKEKEGKALYLSYDEKLQLVARSQQVLHGPCSDQNAAPQVGYLDVIGRDRRQAWKALGNASKKDAMRGYIRILDEACPIFRPYVEAHKRDLEEKERREEENRRLRQVAEDEEQRLAAEETYQRQQSELRRLELQRQQIQEALNQQTCFQFQAYARQQFPNDTDRQSSLIRQLQEQHYQQYVQQVYQQQQQIELQQKSQQSAGSSVAAAATLSPMDDNRNRLSTVTANDVDEGSAGESNDVSGSSRSQTPDPSSVKPASMWTRKDIVEFKRSVTGEEGGGDSVIRVGHGETVTVRVPTHEDGTCLFWEFATDGYDIGFGVYFEWTETPGTQVSVHVSESEDEEDDDEVSGGGSIEAGDVEKGGPMPSSALTDPGAEAAPPLTIIIPIYRRDCHEEVYAGSHAYPGQGVYLLKFDNSYSLWRSKTLYYRVYYTH